MCETLLCLYGAHTICETVLIVDALLLHPDGRGYVIIYGAL